MTRSELDLLQSYANRAFSATSPTTRTPPQNGDINSFVDSSASSCFSDSTSSDAETVVAPLDATFRRPQQATIKPVAERKEVVIRGAGRQTATVLRPEQLYEEMAPTRSAKTSSTKAASSSSVPDVVDSCCIDLDDEVDEIAEQKKKNKARAIIDNNNDNSNDDRNASNTHAFARVQQQTGRISSTFGGDGVIF